MTNGLRAIHATSWDDVLKLPVSNWLWLDMAEGGLHRGELPPAQPAQLSHAWGWTDELLVRLRFDQNLPHGIVGAEINAANAGAPTEVEVWHNGSGKIRMVSDAFHTEAGDARVRLEQFTVAVEARDGEGRVRMPLTFFRLRSRDSA